MRTKALTVLGVIFGATMAAANVDESEPEAIPPETETVAHRICYADGTCDSLADEEVRPIPIVHKICEKDREETLFSKTLDVNQFFIQFTVISAQIEVAPEDALHGQLTQTRCTVRTREGGEEVVMLPGGVLPDGASDAKCSTPVICRPTRSYTSIGTFGEDGEVWVLANEFVAETTDCVGAL